MIGGTYGSGGGLGLGLSIAEEVEVSHDVPWLRAGDGATEAQNLAGKQPPDQTNRVDRAVVAWNGNVDVAAMEFKSEAVVASNHT